MLWPYGGRHFTFAGNLYVPSVTLNQMQDRIVDLFSDHSLVECMARPRAYEITVASSGVNSGENFWVPSWVPDETNPEYGYKSNALVPLDFILRARVSLVLKNLKIKWYNGHPTNQASNAFALYKPDINFDTAASAPSLGSAIASVNPTTALQSWDSVSMDSIDATMAEGETFMLTLEPMANTLDRFAGIQATVRPLTASS